MNLQAIIKGQTIADRRGRFEREVTGITADSRAVEPGDVFVAIRGLNHDGHEHIGAALDRGAVAVIAEEWPEDLEARARGVDIVLVPSTRRSLGPAAANFYGQPSRKLHVAGVTGTNGKTTVSYVLESIIKASGRKVGVMGTVEARFGRRSLALGHTTPGAIELQRTLAAMVEDGVSHAVLEVSSHALDQQRTAGVHFKVAGFTNLSQDHLDYHKTLDTYFEAKARLFSDGLRKSRARGRMAVVDVDDPRGPEIVERWGGKTLRVSLDADDPEAEVVVLTAEYRLDGTTARIRTSKGEWDIETALVGRHNLSNTCVAVGMALAMGFSKARILRGLKALERIPGRLERIPDEQGRVVFVDYAHSPDALEKVLSSLADHSDGKLYVVFGAGGERDKEKREAMGEVVGRIAHRVFVTNDNPRTEEPVEIAAALARGLDKAGCSATGGDEAGHKIELDRQQAIHLAVAALSPGDVLLVAGKGHEAIQIVGTKRYRFDDRAVARRALDGLPPGDIEDLPADAPSALPQRSETVIVVADDVVDETFEVEDGSIEAARTESNPPSADAPSASEAVRENEVDEQDDASCADETASDESEETNK